MSLGTDLQTIALTLLTDFGEAITFTRVTEGAYSVSSSTVASGSSTTFTGYGLTEAYNKAEVDGSTVIMNDLRLTVNKVSSVPLPGDVVTVNSTDYRVIDVERVRASGVDVIYICQLRL